MLARVFKMFELTNSDPSFTFKNVWQGRPPPFFFFFFKKEDKCILSSATKVNVNLKSAYKRRRVGRNVSRADM